WGLNQWARASDEHLVRIISGINWTLFNGYITWLMHRYTRRTERVELDHILVVVITYILIGLTYSSAYVNLLFIDPTSFNIDPALLQSEKEAWQVLLYYSFMTLTTVGYGDITPHTHLARMLASSEAIMGVMFIAIFVARMISMYVGDRSR
ncbi:MAG: potassium channel family protein, partial [bacterium]